MLKELPQNIKRADLKKVSNLDWEYTNKLQIEPDSNEIDRFFSLVDDLDNDVIVKNQLGRRKTLILQFKKGPLLPN